MRKPVCQSQSPALMELLEDRRLFSSYAITDLGTLGGSTSSALAINASGEVVGDSTTAAGDTHAFLYANGTMTDLRTLGGTDSYAYGINAAGQVVGTAGGADGYDHAFLYSNGVMTDLGTLGGSSSTAEGINAAGEIVGFSDTAAGPVHAFSYTNGVMTDLGTLGGDKSVAYSVNSSGQIAGYSTLASGLERAFLYSGGTMKNLGTLGGSQSFAYSGLNDAGAVAGDSSTGATGHPFHAFLYTGGALADLGTLGGDDIYVRGVNASNQVVGDSLNAGGSAYDAFVYSNGAMTDLNSAIPASTGWVLSDGEGINDSGQIVGSGTLNGNLHAFVVTPDSTTPTGSTGVLTPTILKQVIPMAVVAGKPIHGKISLKVTNTSSATVKGTATFQLLASTDGTADSSDTAVVTLKKGVNIKPGKFKTVNLSVMSLPAGLANGTYTLFAQATDLAGNTAAVAGPAITVAAPFVSLTTLSTTLLPTTVGAGKTAKLSIVLYNSGSIDSSGPATFTLSGVPVSGTSVPLGTQTRTIKVKVGKKITVKLNVKIPADAIAGQYLATSLVVQNGSSSSSEGESFTISA